jgi:hypothetical protein
VSIQRLDLQKAREGKREEEDLPNLPRTPQTIQYFRHFAWAGRIREREKRKGSMQPPTKGGEQ